MPWFILYRLCVFYTRYSVQYAAVTALKPLHAQINKISVLNLCSRMPLLHSLKSALSKFQLFCSSMSTYHRQPHTLLLHKLTYYELLCGCGCGSRGSSIVSGYGLDDRVIEFRSPAESNGFSFSSLSVQTRSAAHPASYPMGTEGHFPGVKRSRGVTLTTHLI
jgi:hypothetical protein